MLPSTDQHPPVLHSALWFEPIPLAGPIDTAGAEDSPFILPDGSALYFFFTPDARKPANEQLFDEVSGIWCSQWNGSGWSEPSRVWLQDKGKLALDGAAFVQDDEMWFASAREGYTGVNLFTARQGGRWTDWEYAGDRVTRTSGGRDAHHRRRNSCTSIPNAPEAWAGWTSGVDLDRRAMAGTGQPRGRELPWQ